jgi:hypothetical protein
MARLLNNLLGIGIDKRSERLMIGRMLCHLIHLIPGNIATNGFAALTALKVVIGAVGALPHHTEPSRLHSLNLTDLLKDFRRCSSVHGYCVYCHVYTFNHKNTYFFTSS